MESSPVSALGNYLAEAESRAPSHPPLIVARPITEFVLPTWNDPNELINHRFLCRGGGALFFGPTGVGKSVLLVQMAIMWALGRECLGFRPTGRLKSLIVQAENDPGDIGEMYNSMKRRMNLTPEEEAIVTANVLIVMVDSLSGDGLCRQVLEPLLKQHRPDILWLDPANAYHGGDVNKQPDVSNFLRQQINPLIRKYDCACILAHHTNKPAGLKADKVDLRGSDLAYMGSGSAEWANWPRAVFGLMGTHEHGIFRLVLGKRGPRLRWQRHELPVYEKFIAYDREPGVMWWREADDEVAAMVVESNGKLAQGKTVEDLVALVPLEGNLNKDNLQHRATTNGFKVSEYKAILSEALDRKLLFKIGVKRSGTGEEIRYGRKPQSEPVLLTEPAVTHDMQGERPRKARKMKSRKPLRIKK